MRSALLCDLENRYAEYWIRLDLTKRDQARVGVAIEEHSTPPAPPERWPPGSMLDPLGLWWVLHRPRVRGRWRLGWGNGATRSPHSHPSYASSVPAAVVSRLPRPSLVRPSHPPTCSVGSAASARSLAPRRPRALRAAYPSRVPPAALEPPRLAVPSVLPARTNKRNFRTGWAAHTEIRLDFT